MKRKANDIYLPLKATIAEIIDMTPDIKLFRIKPGVEFRYEPGQFVMFSLWGAGEVPISITSNYGLHENLELCIRRVGYVTSKIRLLKPSAEIGIRGPFGNTFPVENARGRDILFVAGGLGIAPLRPLITKVINEKNPPSPPHPPLSKGGQGGVKGGRGGLSGGKDDFKKIALVYGSRNPSEVLFRDDIKTWQKMGMHVILTVDKGNKGWKGEVGLVTEYINK
jgi:NAD(P)H-flavin reductase